MKAWLVELPEEFCSLFHAETRGRAKLKIKECFGLSVDFIDICATRLPALDDIPITYENAKEAKFEYFDQDTGKKLAKEEFVNDCHCDICKGG